MLDLQSPGLKRILTFRVGKGNFGFPLEWVCGLDEGTGSVREESGTITTRFRGREVPVIDIGRWLEMGISKDEASNLLVVGRGEEMAAALVSQTGELVETESIQEWPPLCRPLVEGVFTGVVCHAENLVLVVDPEGILREARRGWDRPAEEANGNDP
jgi:chemotaxis signal transduction protein